MRGARRTGVQRTEYEAVWRTPGLGIGKPRHSCI